MKKIMTVCGEINASELGVTSIHEHTLIDMKARYQSGLEELGLPAGEGERFALKPENIMFLRNMGFYQQKQFFYNEDYEATKKELVYFREAGGNSLVDAGPTDIRGDIKQLRKLSEESGVNIICSTGLFDRNQRHGAYLNMSEDEMFRMFMKEISEGIDGTNMRAGSVKCAVTRYDEPGKVCDAEMKSIRACAHAAAASGLLLSIHQEGAIAIDTLVDLVGMLINELGVAPEKILMNHLDTRLLCIMQADYARGAAKREVDISVFERLLELGINVAFDTIAGSITARDCGVILADDYDRLRSVVMLIEKGYEDRMMLGQDCILPISGKCMGLSGYCRILEYFVPALWAAGVGKEITEKFLVKNPEKVLSY